MKRTASRFSSAIAAQARPSEGYRLKRYFRAGREGILRCECRWRQPRLWRVIFAGKDGVENLLFLIKKAVAGPRYCFINAVPMLKLTPIVLLFGCVMAASATAAQSTTAPSKKRFVYRDAAGSSVSVLLVDDATRRKLSKPVLAKVDPGIDPKLTRAATIAQERAHARSKSRCWRYVKQALVAAGVVSSYPKTAYAKQAGDELTRNYGFRKLPIRDPYAAPVGAVLVYTAKGAGHVEIRTKTGFVSDFRTPTPSRRKLIGVYGKA